MVVGGGGEVVVLVDVVEVLVVLVLVDVEDVVDEVVELPPQGPWDRLNCPDQPP